MEKASERVADLCHLAFVGLFSAGVCGYMYKNVNDIRLKCDLGQKVVLHLYIFQL